MTLVVGPAYLAGHRDPGIWYLPQPEPASGTPLHVWGNQAIRHLLAILSHDDHERIELRKEDVLPRTDVSSLVR
jgi:hypothetical protein